MPQDAVLTPAEEHVAAGRMPNFLIVGAEKAGTTWLFDALIRHPGIFGPDAKELHYFNRRDSNLNVTDRYTAEGPDWYARYFADARPDQIVGEATPMYLCDDAAPARIAAALPEVRLVVSLREPVSRAISHWRMARAKAHIPQNATLEALLDADDDRILRRGLYAAQMRRLFKVFPRDRVEVLFFEEAITGQRATLTALARALGAETPEWFADGDIPASSNEATNYRSAGFYNLSIRAARALRGSAMTRGVARGLKAAGVYDRIKAANKAPAERVEIPAETRARLAAYYAADKADLAQVLGRDLPWLEDAA